MMDRATRATGRHPSAPTLGVVAATSMAWFVMACPVSPPNPVAMGVIDSYCDLHGSLLEVVNDALDRVTVVIALKKESIVLNWTTDGTPYIGSETGLVAIESNEVREFDLNGGPCEPGRDNWLGSSFAQIAFFDGASAEPYRTYSYELARCGDEECSEESYIFLSSDGTLDKLFVETLDRPFYLETYEGWLARIVITFVPSAEDRAESSANRSVGES